MVLTVNGNDQIDEKFNNETFYEEVEQEVNVKE